MHIKVTADSTCDLSEQLLRQYDITLMPLIVVKEGVPFYDGQTITPEEIFRHVEEGGDLCGTAARNPEEYGDFFRKLRREYDAVIHISLGSGFSATCQNARIAARELEDVYVVDSQNLSTGQGLVVLEACRLASGGGDVQEMVRKLESFTQRVETSFLLSRLDYMVKGGRCSAVAALGANFLKLKPCIEVSNGRMRVCKKYRGTFEHCIRNYIQDRLGPAREDLNRSRLFLTYTPVEQSVLQAAQSAIESCPPFSQRMQTQAGCTVSCHCGPGTLGVLFVRREP